MSSRRFKHYEILETLGRGGMGVVYLALDTTLERKVALKFLPRTLMGDPAAQGRLLDEARSCSRIQHPNIGVIHSIEEDGGVYAICMEYVEGRTLKQIVAAGQLSLPRVARIGRAIAAGMIAAHEEGVIHRDLKPANVMLTIRGEVKIMDFGLAVRPKRVVSTAGPNTFGTVGYMSPEQAQGKTLTPASDVFSFGSTLYEILTGQPPFRGENDLATLHLIISNEASAIREIRRDAPPALVRLIESCMRKDPMLRPSMSEVAEELQYVEPVVETGPRDLILELAHELGETDVVEVKGRDSGRQSSVGRRQARRNGPRPRTPEPTESDQPRVAPLLTVPDSGQRPVANDDSPIRRPLPIDQLPDRSGGLVIESTSEFWQDMSQQSPSASPSPPPRTPPRREPAPRPRSSAPEASRAEPRFVGPQESGIGAGRETLEGPPTGGHHHLRNVLGIVLALALTALGVLGLVRVATRATEPPTETEAPATPPGSSR